MTPRADVLHAAVLGLAVQAVLDPAGYPAERQVELVDELLARVIADRPPAARAVNRPSAVRNRSRWFDAPLDDVTPAAGARRTAAAPFPVPPPRTPAPLRPTAVDTVAVVRRSFTKPSPAERDSSVPPLAPS